MNLIVVTEPPVEPVTLEQIYDFLRLDPDGSPLSHPDDEMLLSMIKSAREKFEQTTRRALIQQRIRLTISAFPRYTMHDHYDSDFWFARDGYVELLRPPLRELHSVKYYDQFNALQTLDPATYFINDSELVPQLQLNIGYYWPLTFLRRSDAVQIEYTVGYAPEGSPPSDYRANIPASLLQSVKFEVQLQYDELAPEKRQNIQDTISRLERSFVIPKFVSSSHPRGFDR